MQNDPATDPEAEIRGDIELLKKVLAKWLVGHCPTSKALVGQYCSRKCVALMMAYSSKTTRQRAASVCVVLESLSGAVIGCADDMFRPTCCINDVQDWARSLDAAKGVTATLFVLGTDTPLDGGTELGFLATQQLQQQQQQQEQEQPVRVVLVGQGYGALLNHEFLKRYPRRVAGVLALDPAVLGAKARQRRIDPAVAAAAESILGQTDHLVRACVRACVDSDRSLLLRMMMRSAIEFVVLRYDCCCLLINTVTGIRSPTSSSS